MPRKDQGWITFQTSEEERQLLEAICQRSQRTKTEVLREMLRGLKQSGDSETTGEIAQEAAVDRAVSSSKKPLKVSSRNVLEGKVKRLVKGSIHTEVTIEVVHRVELTSTITTTSAEVLELEEGKTAYAVIKSSDVVIAME
ncbi:molybdopterin-binding protein [Leptolyngbya sp. FACHB-17]|uniref:TOBE domain-containing protein n=1 Tax=unclassified Leptolyngbya TaxID=2650499 RepID=UPI001680FCDD|nr:molybdopterin-binding protein [Leptolyngbya sp. FACHB-17]MBD2080996.1 TOBE domain-containing protein [Leptolyngbya sp. FACHB-17]